MAKSNVIFGQTNGLLLTCTWCWPALINYQIEPHQVLWIYFTVYEYKLIYHFSYFEWGIKVLEFEVNPAPTGALVSLTPEYLCLQGWPTFNDFHSSSIQWPQRQGQWGLLAAQHSLSSLRPEMWENPLALPTQYQVWGHRVITMKGIFTKSILNEKLIAFHLPHSIGPIIMKLGTQNRVNSMLSAKLKKYSTFGKEDIDE